MANVSNSQTRFGTDAVNWGDGSIQSSLLLCICWLHWCGNCYAHPLCTVPVWVALLASLLLREKFTLAIFFALICAVGGTVLLINVRSGHIIVRSHAILGVLLALGSAFGYASVTLCSRFLAKRNHPLQSLTVGFLAGVIFLLPIALISGLVIQYPLVSWVSLFYLGTVTTALAYLLYFSGMQHTRAIVASITTLLEPLTVLKQFYKSK